MRARYLVGLIVLNAVALEFLLWREFETVWVGKLNKPPIESVFESHFINLAFAAMLNFAAGIFAFHKVYGGSGFAGWEHSVWSVFVQWLCLTVLVVPVALVVPLGVALAVPSASSAALKLAFFNYGLPVTLVAASWNLAFVLLYRPRP